MISVDVNISDWVQTTLQHYPCLSETNQTFDNVAENRTSVNSQPKTRNQTEGVNAYVTEEVTEDITEDVTEDVTEVVTDGVTENLTENVTEDKTLNVTDDYKVETQEFESEPFLLDVNLVAELIVGKLINEL